MSALPPRPTKLVCRNEVTLCATTGREQMQQLWKAELLDYFVGEREAA
jgi:hypothetical protein